MADQLRRRLPDQAWKAARATTPNAHYTSTTVADAVWQCVTDLGFTGGRILEPGCGSGNFLSLAPEHLPLDVVGIEKDPTTARIAGLLHPSATVLAQPFEEAELTEAGFDLAIGNVPFANVSPYDPVHNRAGWSLHNYFIAKSTALVRPGGLIVLITSRYTLDQRSPTFRRWLAGEVDFLGAVRLPGSAFTAVAGTRAICDVLVLRRRLESSTLAEPWLDGSHGWIDTRPLPDAATGREGETLVNEWFLDDPATRVCGTLAVGRGQYRDDDLVVDLHPGELPERVRTALAGITSQAVRDGLTFEPDHSPRPRSRASPAAPAEHDHDAVGAGLPDGSLVVTGPASFGRVVGAGVEEHPVPATQRKELRLLIGLRDSVRRLLHAESTDAPAGIIDAVRAELNQAYDQYSVTIGSLNRSTPSAGRVDSTTGEATTVRRFPRMGGFRSDPGWPIVAALEHFDDDTGIATRANIFTSRVIRPRAPAASAEDPSDAIAISLERTGGVDVELIAGLLSVDAGEAASAIAPFTFAEPESGRLVPSDEYLSGNVRAKLVRAEQAQRADPAGGWRCNVEALRGALPTELGPGQIDASLGAPWIDPDDVAGFVDEVLGAEGALVVHDPLVAAWEIGVPSWRKGSVLMTSTWGTHRRSAIDLLDAALNQRPVTVWDTLPDDRRVVNETDTMAARDKLEALGDRFRTWIWEDPARADRLCRVYNERFNAIAPRRFDGSHLQLPGLADWFNPHQHQRDAVWRIVSQGDVLLAHVVGAGKTATMVMAAMEMRRLGLVNKPCFVVPNHMLEQFTREFLQLYPQAKVLAANLGGTTPESRRRFVAQCATGDWDGVILPRESFRSIPVTREVEEQFLQRRVDELEDALSSNTGRPKVKELEKALARERARLQRLLNAPARDVSVCFEQTGLDYLFVDEGHGFKGKRITTRIPDVAGVESQRATDLDMKLAWLRTRTPGRVVTMATGTPIANAIAEMWVMQSYVQPAVLDAAGVEHFDGWAATFASTVTSMELKPSGGGYQQKTRFARYRNVPELLRLFHANADLRTAEDLKLPIPTVIEGGETVAVAPSRALTAFVETLVDRADRVRNRAVPPTEDNMLKITSDGRKAALDMRLVAAGGVPAESALVPGLDFDGKVHACARHVAATFHDNRDRGYLAEDGKQSPVPGALQIVFCDLGTPNSDGSWSVYRELRDRLTDLGVPREMVRFAHEASNDRQKAELFRACPEGRVGVLIGSTEKMGVGTNIQARAIALHHLDCPWRPADLEQREGRILRQGNQNPDVHVVRYVTEGSFDVFMWATVTRKAKFLSQVMTSNPEAVARELDDVGDQALTYAQVTAIATGDPRIVEKADLEQQLAKLRRLEAAHQAEQALLRRRVGEWTTDIERLSSKLARYRNAEAVRQPTGGEAFRVKMPDGQVITSRAEWGDHVRHTITDTASPFQHRELRVPLGHLGGLDIELHVPDQRIQHSAAIEITVTRQRILITRAEAVDADPVGLTRRIENTLDRIPAGLDETEQLLEHTRQQLASAEERLGIPFPKKDEIATCSQRLAHLDAALTPPAARAAEPTTTPSRRPPSLSL